MLLYTRFFRGISWGTGDGTKHKYYIYNQNHRQRKILHMQTENVASLDYTNGGKSIFSRKRTSETPSF